MATISELRYAINYVKKWGDRHNTQYKGVRDQIRFVKNCENSIGFFDSSDKPLTKEQEEMLGHLNEIIYMWNTD